MLAIHKDFANGADLKAFTVLCKIVEFEHYFYTSAKSFPPSLRAQHAELATIFFFIVFYMSYGRFFSDLR